MSEREIGRRKGGWDGSKSEGRGREGDGVRQPVGNCSPPGEQDSKRKTKGTSVESWGDLQTQTQDKDSQRGERRREKSVEECNTDSDTRDREKREITGEQREIAGERKRGRERGREGGREGGRVVLTRRQASESSVGIRIFDHMNGVLKP